MSLATFSELGTQALTRSPGEGSRLPGQTLQEPWRSQGTQTLGECAASWAGSGPGSLPLG